MLKFCIDYGNEGFGYSVYEVTDGQELILLHESALKFNTEGAARSAAQLWIRNHT